MADADHVYWTQKDQTFENRLLRAPLAGDGAAELMAEGQNIHYPFTLDDRVIWVDLPARMFALAK